MAGSSGLAFLYPFPASGQSDERLTVSNTAIQFSSLSTWAASNMVKLITLDIQGANVFVTFDGSNPTTTNGHLLYVGQNYTWSFGKAKAAKFIRATATDATIHASPESY